MDRLIQNRTTLIIIGILIFAVYISIIDKGPGHKNAPIAAADKRTPMPRLTADISTGGKWQLSDHLGKVVLVNYWATWCGPCRAETPDLVSIASTFQARGLDVAAIASSDSPLDQIKQYTAEYNVPYPILNASDSDEFGRSVAAFPTTVLIDKHGRVATVIEGGVDKESISKEIEKLLAEK